MSKEKLPKIIKEFNDDESIVQAYSNVWDEKEKIILGVPYDQVSLTETKSKVVDPTLLTSVIRQNNSVMAQMPTGKVVALTKENRGKSLFMDIIFHNQILPNAKLQYGDIYTKLWLLSFYRKVYGSFGVLVDFVENKGYTGPDFSLIPIRNLIPQSGKTTLEDSDYVSVITYVTKKWLEERDRKYWKNIDKVIEKEGDSITDKSYVERTKKGNNTIKGVFKLVTRYEKDRWITFHPSTGEILRDMKNPQDNDQLPVVMCHSYPLIDRFWGLGEFERGETLHLAAGSLINLYLEGVKLNIFPRWKIDPQYVDNWSDLEDGMGPGQIILMKRQFFDAVEQVATIPSGLQSFQSTYNFLKAAIMTVTNTTDTSISQFQDIGLGKTPQALKMQALNQGMQTNFDRRMLEIAIEEIYDRMIDLMARKQKDPMKIYLKEKDLKKIEEIAPDVVEMFEVGEMGKVIIKPEHFNNVEYRYEIDQGSTLKKDEALENIGLEEILLFISKLPNVMNILEKDGVLPLGKKAVDVGELIKRWIITKGITDWDKIVIERQENIGEFQNQEENKLNTEQPEINRAVSENFQQGVNFRDPMVAEVFRQLQGIGGQTNEPETG